MTVRRRCACARPLQPPSPRFSRSPHFGWRQSRKCARFEAPWTRCMPSERRAVSRAICARARMLQGLMRSRLYLSCTTAIRCQPAGQGRVQAAVELESWSLRRPKSCRRRSASRQRGSGLGGPAGDLFSSGACKPFMRRACANSMRGVRLARRNTGEISRAQPAPSQLGFGTTGVPAPQKTNPDGSCSRIGMDSASTDRWTQRRVGSFGYDPRLRPISWTSTSIRVDGATGCSRSRTLDALAAAGEQQHVFSGALQNKQWG